MNNKKRMTLEEAKAMFPDNTPVFYFPVVNEEALKRPTWVRGEPWEVSDGQVIVRVKDATGGVAVEHLVLREHGEHPAPLEATVEQFAPATDQPGKNWVPFEEGETLNPPVIYQYAATINTSRGTVSYDGIVFRPGYIRSMDDYQSIRQEVARDANVDDANAVNIINLNIVGGQLYEALVEGGL